MTSGTNIGRLINLNFFAIMQRLSQFARVAPRHRRLLILSLGLLALVAAHGMALIYRIQPGVSLWFPPSGVAIALSFWFGIDGIILTGLASFLMSPFWGLYGWEQCISFTDVVEPLVAWLLYCRLWKGSLIFNSLKDAAIFTLSVPLIASTSLAVVGSLTWVAIGKMPITNLTTSITHWWLGNAIGIMGITPTILLILTPYLQSWGWLSRSQISDSASPAFRFLACRPLLIEVSTILFLCISIASVTVSEVSANSNTDFRFQQLSFLSFIPVMWAATRFGVSTGMIISTFSILITLFSYLLIYPNAILLPRFPVQPEVLHVHKLSLLVQSMVTLLVGVAITERAKIQVELAIEKFRIGEYQARAELSEKLIQLNDSLVQTNVHLEDSNREKDKLLKAEKALRNRLSNILESMTDAFIAVNQDWQITYINQQAANIQGVKPETIVAQNYWEQWPGMQGQEFEREYYRAIAESIPVHFEALYIPKNMWLEIHAYPFEDGLGIFFRDITERKEAEVERANILAREQSARSEAEKANKIKDEFIAVLSHELRTPLNPILGWVTLLRRRNYEDDKLTHGLETIERNAKLQIQLIEDLLDISRIQQRKIILNLQPVNLIEILQASLDTVALAVEAKKLQVNKIFHVDTAWVTGDAERLQQIICNLLSNAIKFTPAAGKVEIILEQVDTFAHIQIQDNGKGISPEFLPFVFDYFRQADGTITRQFGGLGLGLAIVRHLTELHGGTVQAESLGEGMGAKFTVQLPLMLDFIPQNKNTATVHHDLNLAGLHILVVDDDLDTGKFLTVVLEQLGAKVSAIASGSQALEFLATSKADILLSDIGMPGIDGYMLMRLIRALPPERGGQIPAIALTAYAGEINQQQALAAGFQIHLVKPVEQPQLLKAIAQILPNL
ncbi:MASE1 domain-containing protein [Nostoc sp. PCC 7107]|uniref:MASE1 domain-containing protein n=1 Tax=Nostoc sp. PCC 7107 TaxID=317936 RepID=UPI00029F0CB5|nr:MASE1 domain-containing protein [Nostoc sp. PCC 7107]AFY42055.1 multi-sensor hybrid histidine kinase [Nostoc sp. PCC 7107]